MLSVTTVIVLCVGAAAMIFLGIFLSRLDANRYERMSAQEKKETKEDENNTKKKK